MRLTDFALIFVAIFLPVVIIVYVNISFLVKSEKQEMYYKNLMNSAVQDAVSSMKQVENEDENIDYGYSGIVDNKVSINANMAVNTFFNSLSSSFNINNNTMSLEHLKMYIPVVAVLDYDGIYIHSAEKDITTGNTIFVTKPKVKYMHTYTSGSLTYEVTFTMDDYIYLTRYRSNGEIYDTRSFYLTDSKMNGVLGNNAKIKELESIRTATIARIAMQEISYAVNKHNDFARLTGIKYSFQFSVASDEEWYETMDGIGMIAIIQGISLGNRYLNYKAYSASDLVSANKYYLSKGVVSESGTDISYLARNLYHMSNECKAYLSWKNHTEEKLVPAFYINRAEAATQGYYPCPICKP